MKNPCPCGAERLSGVKAIEVISERTEGLGSLLMVRGPENMGESTEHRAPSTGQQRLDRHSLPERKKE